jgi:hypothetical protein
MKRCYIPKTFYKKTAELLSECDAICTTYAAKGYTLTLRQLFYQLVATNKIENTVREYKNLGVVVTDGRYAGWLDWEHITDRVRVIQRKPRWQDVEDFVNVVAPQFAVDTWQKQLYRPEVWIEKDALIELAAEACEPLDVPYIAVKAYNSASAMWEATKRFREYRRDGQIPLILHLGDHDYTGDDCSRFLQERMTLLTDGLVELRRLALNRDQIEKYELPPQPGKQADPRFRGYLEKHQTTEVWELDALPPDVIVRIIEDGIHDVLEDDARQPYVAECVEGRELLQAVSNKWNAVKWLVHKSTVDGFQDDFQGEGL